MPLALALLGTAVPPPLRPKALGVFAGVSGAAVALGPLLGGAVVEGVSWPWIFWLNVPLALVLIPLARRRLAESVGPPAAIDLGGVTLVTTSAFGIVWGLVRANAVGWGSAEVLVALIAGGALAVCFVLWERRAQAPMLPLRLFRSRSFAAGNVAVFFHWGSALGAVFFMAQFFQVALGYGPFKAGVALMPWGATTVVIPQLVGPRIRRFGERPFITAGLTLNAAALLWIALVAGPAVPYWQIGIPLLLSGAGIATSVPAAQSAVLSSAAPPDMGKASGTFSTTRQLGGALGVAVLVAVFTGAGSYASPQGFSNGFVAAAVACACISLIGAAAGAAVPSVRRSSEAATPPVSPRAVPALDPEAG